MNHANNRKVLTSYAPNASLSDSVRNLKAVEIISSYLSFCFAMVSYILSMMFMSLRCMFDVGSCWNFLTLSLYTLMAL